MSEWIPRTELGKLAAKGEITLDGIFTQGKKIKEAGIIDTLIPNLQTDIIFIGGSPGKGGGIMRTPTRRTARMHRSGRRYRTQAMVIAGNGDGYIGIGMSESVENRKAIEKATEAAKLNIMPVRRGCGSWECACGEPHTIPYEVEGKAGSVRVKLIPAPKGIGLCINDEAKKVMRIAGIKDIWSKCYGSSKTRNNYALALFDAFRKINKMRTEAKKNHDEVEEENTEVEM
ncbi:30S ribosomal protein S5 [archaeon]|nr:30S ribosomal protein S5 [archaeon]